MPRRPVTSIPSIGSMVLVSPRCTLTSQIVGLCGVVVAHLSEVRVRVRIFESPFENWTTWFYLGELEYMDDDEAVMCVLGDMFETS